MTEAACDRRTPGLVGREARLELVFGCRGGRTVLDHAYAEPPYRVGRCFPEGRGLHLILASSAPGVFGGDSLEQHIRLQAGAHVRLTSQSATQVHPSTRASACVIHTRYDVADEARLTCEWDPVIPFASARLHQRIELHLDAGASLYWSDAFMAGRISSGRGERWMFTELAHELMVWRAGRLDYLERFHLASGREASANPWVGGEDNYFSTTLVSRRDLGQEAATSLHHDLEQREGVRAAADLIARELLLVRLTAPAGPPFHAARRTIAQKLA